MSKTSKSSKTKMVCSLCGSNYGNKQSCPLNNNFNEWQKHGNACMMIQYKAQQGIQKYEKILQKIKNNSKNNSDGYNNMHCSYCGSVCVNSQTCPLNKNAKNIDYGLHFCNKKIPTKILQQECFNF